MAREKDKSIDVFVGDQELAEEVQRTVRRLPAQIRKYLNIHTQWERFHPHPSRWTYLLFNIWNLVDPVHFERMHSVDSRWRRYLLFTGGLRPESIGQYLVKLSSRKDENLHLAHPAGESREAYLWRFFNALFALPEERAIFAAWREFRLFMVKAPDYKLLRVPLADLPQLAEVAPEVIDHFELAEKGESIYWPELDLSLTWDDFELLVEPQARLRAEQKDPDYVVRYGQAVEALRERAGIPREAIPGLGSRTVRRIERGETRTTANAIRKLAAAHQLSEEEYIARVAELMVRPEKG